LVEAYFELLMSRNAGFNVTTYWLRRLERNGLIPSLKLYSIIIYRFVYTNREPEAFQFVLRARLLDPENYKDTIFSAIIRACVARKDLRSANFFMLNWINSNCRQRRVPADILKFLIMNLAEINGKPTWAFKFYSVWRTKKYPPDVELDSRILQLYHDHNVFGEKKFAGTQMRYTNAWKDDIEMYHNFVEDSSGMYDDDL